MECTSSFGEANKSHACSTALYACSLSSPDASAAIMGTKLAELLFHPCGADDALVNGNKPQQPERQPPLSKKHNGVGVCLYTALGVASPLPMVVAATPLFPSVSSGSMSPAPMTSCAHQQPSPFFSPYTSRAASPTQHCSFASFQSSTQCCLSVTPGTVVLDACGAICSQLQLPTSVVCEQATLKRMQVWLREKSSSLPAKTPVPRRSTPTGAARAPSPEEKTLCTAAAVVLRTSKDARALLLALRFLVAAAVEFRLPLALGTALGFSSEDCARVAAVVLRQAHRGAGSPFLWAAEVLDLLQPLLSAQPAVTVTELLFTAPAYATPECRMTATATMAPTCAQGILAHLVILASRAWTAQCDAQHRQEVLLAEAKRAVAHRRHFVCRLIEVSMELLRVCNSSSNNRGGRVHSATLASLLVTTLCGGASSATLWLGALNDAAEELIRALTTQGSFGSSDEDEEVLKPLRVVQCSVGFLLELHRLLAQQPQMACVETERMLVTAMLTAGTVPVLVRLASALQRRLASTGVTVQSVMGDFYANLSQLLMQSTLCAVRLGMCRTWLCASTVSVTADAPGAAALTAASAATTISPTATPATAATPLSFLAICASRLAAGVATLTEALQRAQTQAVESAPAGSTDGSTASESASANAAVVSLAKTKLYAAPLTIAQLRRSTGPVGALRRKYESLTAPLFHFARRSTKTDDGEEDARKRMVAELVQQVLSLTSLTTTTHGPHDAFAEDKLPLLNALFDSGVVSQLLVLVRALCPPAGTDSCGVSEALAKLRGVASKDLQVVVSGFTATTTLQGSTSRENGTSTFDLLCGLVLAERSVLAFLNSLILSAPSQAAVAALRLAETYPSSAVASSRTTTTPVVVAVEVCSVLAQYITCVLPVYLAESLSGDGVEAFSSAAVFLTALCDEENRYADPAVAAASSGSALFMTTFRGRKSCAQLLSDVGLLTTLTKVLTTPMRLADCKEVPVLVLHLLEAVLTSPRLTTRCRCDLLQHTPMLLPAVMSLVDGTSWTVSSSSPACQAAEPAPSCIVCPTTGYARSNNNCHLAQLSGPPEELQLPMSAAEHGEKTTEYTQMRVRLQLLALRLLNRWVSVPTVTKTQPDDFSVCEFTADRPLQQRQAPVSPPPHAQLQPPTLTSTGRVSRIRRYGGGGSANSSTASSPMGSQGSSFCASFLSAHSGSDRGSGGPNVTPATLDCAAPLADCSAFMEFIRGVLDRDELLKLLDLSAKQFDSEYAEVEGTSEEEVNESEPVDAPSEEAAVACNDTINETVTEVHVSGPVQCDSKLPQQVECEQQPLLAAHEAEASGTLVVPPPLPDSDPRTHQLRLVQEALQLVRNIVSGPHFTFKSAWLGLCVKITKAYDGLLARRENTEKRLYDSLRVMACCQHDAQAAATMLSSSGGGAAAKKRLCFAQKVAALALAESALMDRLLETTMCYLERSDRDVEVEWQRVQSQGGAKGPASSSTARPTSATVLPPTGACGVSVAAAAVTVTAVQPGSSADDEQPHQPPYSSTGVQSCLLDIVAHNINAAAVDRALQSATTFSSQVLRSTHKATHGERERDAGPLNASPCTAQLLENDGDEQQRATSMLWAAPVGSTGAALHIQMMSTLLKKVKKGCEVKVEAV